MFDKTNRLWVIEGVGTAQKLVQVVLGGTSCFCGLDDVTGNYLGLFVIENLYTRNLVVGRSLSPENTIISDEFFHMGFVRLPLTGPDLSARGSYRVVVFMIWI